MLYKETRFVWASAAGPTATPWAGDTKISSVWRGLAKRVDETAVLLARPVLHDAHAKVVKSHQVAMTNVTARFPKSQRASLEEQALKFSVAFDNAVGAQSICWLKSLAALAMKKADAIEQKVAACRRQHWKDIIGVTQAIGIKKSKPTKAAFHFVRGTEGWTPSPIADTRFEADVPRDPDDPPDLPDACDDSFLHNEISAFVPDGNGALIAPLSDQGNVEKQADTWAELWQTSHTYVQPAFRITSEFFTDFLPLAILEAAMTFPADTGLGHDNVSPRAFARLSYNALSALAALYLAFERYGAWADLLNLVLIVLLPKGEGGYRPIGLFPTVIRI